VAWQKTYGTAEEEFSRSLFPRAGGGMLVAGTTRSSGAGLADLWVLEVSDSGLPEWQRAYGGNDDDFGRSVCEYQDGGWMAAGGTRSFGAGLGDAWMLRCEPDGTIVFSPTGGATIRDTKALVNDTSVQGQDTDATVIETSTIPEETNPKVTDTESLIEDQTP
jgi:hypothetical protein